MINGITCFWLSGARLRSWCIGCPWRDQSSPSMPNTCLAWWPGSREACVKNEVSRAYRSRLVCAAATSCGLLFSAAVQSLFIGRRASLTGCGAASKGEGGREMAGAQVAEQEAAALVKRGMREFRENKIAASIATFDAVIASSERRRPYMWQRGLSLYYAGEYAEGARQFRLDVSVNPNDTEESIWAMLCESKLSSFEVAQSNMLVVGRDSRSVMRAAYDLFRGAGSLEALESAGRGVNSHDEFYSLLYQGLYYEARGESVNAERCILNSLETEYGRKSDDYMVSLAVVHAQQRNWNKRSKRSEL
jgi:hypothetical protein